MHVLTVDYKTPEASEKFVQSLRETGFAVVTNHPIKPELIFDTYAEWEAFFASGEKHNYLFDSEQQDGYFPLSVSETAKGYEVKDIKEFFQIYPWGRYPKGMSDKTQRLYREMSSLAAVLLEWIEKHTPVNISAQFSMPLTKMIEDSHRIMLRVLHYPPLTGDEAEGAIRAAPHEDINLITLLPAATAPGLEVLDSLGNWHQVGCDAGSIVVNAADMLQLCSQGYFRSTTHRVTNPEGEAAYKSRLSMPLFLHPRDEVVLSETHTALSYLHERLREIGLM